MNDREILRALAGELAELAALPVQEETRGLYRAVNDLKPIRPVVLVDELPWNQLNGSGELTLRCEEEELRGVEQGLRRTLFRWKHCRGDMIIEPFYRLARDVRLSSIGVEIVETRLNSADETNHIVSHRYTDQLPNEEALQRLKTPSITVDDAATEGRRERLDAMFGDLLPIRVTGVRDAGFFMPWDLLAMWRGVEPLLADLCDRPEFLHAFMRRYTDIRLELLKEMEERGLLDAELPVLHCTAGLVSALPGVIEEGRVTRANCWGRGTAQIFASVSPAMHDEFEIQYAAEFFRGFGLVYYGCCEPLHKKIDIVKKLPNLRKISITPWADVRMAAERMGAEYVLARKPNPAAVAVPAPDVAALKADIRQTLEACRDNGTPCEFTLKDISSVAWHPENLELWTRTVMETVLDF